MVKREYFGSHDENSHKPQRLWDIHLDTFDIDISGNRRHQQEDRENDQMDCTLQDRGSSGA